MTSCSAMLLYNGGVAVYTNIHMLPAFDKIVGSQDDRLSWLQHILA